ncbi:endospore germination permease [Neobacillus cucumis]|uniref:endospore germination permease n=1 Tax=Neobacillus cucumis TaxID=1740721 RepID=UPI0018E055D6|nr:endospore germination permease [Neobacillus cucumis]MBI0577745.1 endospore germination permease [Neobacillus cucumis]
MNKSDSITIIQLILLFMTAIGLKNHVIIIPALVQTAGRDAWMSCILTFLLTFGWIPLLLYIQKKTNQEKLFEWIRKRKWSGIGSLISITVILFLSLAVVVTLKETFTWVKIAFLPETPVFFMILLFMLACCSLAATSLRTISIVNVFLLFFIVILGFFVAITNFQVKRYSLLLPFLEHGPIPVFKSMIFQASGMVEMLVFIFLQHKITMPIRFRHFVVTSLILTGLTIGPLLGAIAEFGPVEAANQRFPAYEEWGLVSLGHFVEHMDFLSIYQWLSGTFIRVSLIFFIIREICPFEKKTKKWIWSILFFLIIALTLWPLSDFVFSRLLLHLLLPLTFWGFFALSIFLGLFVMLFSKKSGGAKNVFKEGKI